MSRTIKVGALARVEGEGGLYVKVAGGRVKEVRLKIFEPPRFFEALLAGRAFDEAPDLTSRICGICPIAYQITAAQAMEQACGAAVDPSIRALRRLIYLGEWIESHALHIYMLHAPDFLGYEDAVRLARDHPGVVERGLQLKKAGNEVMRIVGGREIHPVNLRVGGFHHAPSREELRGLAERLMRAREAALETVRWVAAFPFPDLERDYLFVALRHPSEYPVAEGRIVSSRGLDVPAAEYERHFDEEHVRHSNALHSVVKGEGAYLVGPLARYSLNFDRLAPLAREAAQGAGLGPVCRNPFHSIIVRAVETVQACDEAVGLVEAYEPPSPAAVALEPKAAVGYGATEAPRGLLYHRYQLGEGGRIVGAKIVPPTSQNQKTIEADLGHLVAGNLALDQERLTWLCEQAIRNYDPCISCATHFLHVIIQQPSSSEDHHAD